MSAEVIVGCGNEFPAHYKVMLDRLNEQRQLDQFTDITLIVDGHQFRAHKAVLAACSQFFYKFFQDFKLEPLVEIEGRVSNLAFRHLIEFTYTAKLAVSGNEEVSDVWKAAEYLQMQEAIKALNSRTKSSSPEASKQSPTEKNKAKKRKIAETSNVITETLPSVDTEPVEIEVEIAGGTIEVVEDEGIEVVEEVAVQPDKDASSQDTSDDSALVLLADITSKYQQGESTLHEMKKDGEASCTTDLEAAATAKTLEGIEVVEVQISHLNNLFRCEKCDRSFKLFYHFKQHMKVHSDKAFVCPNCNKTYTRESALKHHLACHHFEVEESRRQRPQKKVHVCGYCEKQFDHFGHFKEHLRKHTGEKPFECPDCHERFARNSTLKCHIAACQNGVGAKKGRKKLYECQVCSMVFNSWDQFKDHLVIHTGDKPNHCTICDIWFTQAGDMRKHLREFHAIHERVVTEVVVPEQEDAEDVHVEHVMVEQVQIESPEVLETIQVQVESVEGEQGKEEHVHMDQVQVEEEKTAEIQVHQPQDEQQSSETLIKEHIEIQVEHAQSSALQHYLETTVQDSEVAVEQVEIQVEEAEVGEVQVEDV
ncbi:zinc finger protein 131-like isoform X1 [Acipenser oxyrinchus oxyrinchus]|uniref:Zinc finger protein 131-like isoform X1 n=1 Tax=Acipenser oxyrinchus oxyrinchus TaxID=40147 RepID=A0AAD8FPC8_ACIOX|nr:zinc finger protein 131-like isoform X1 [Acipenser oxyrinchus oxyrinchus]